MPIEIRKRMKNPQATLGIEGSLCSIEDKLLRSCFSMSLDFQSYLESVRKTYADWQRFYTPTDAAGKQWKSKQASPTFDFGLMVQTVRKEERREEEKIERFPVLEGIRKYADHHVLLVGRPGSGKSTALARLMLEEATSSQDKIPVLVELCYWQTSIDQLILDSLTRHDPEIKSLDQVLSRSLILFDGVNELPSEKSRSQLSAFRCNHPRVPMIFTTRDLSIGGDLGIEKRLEMQPLTEDQMKRFIRSYVLDRVGGLFRELKADIMLQQLEGRLREFGQTPLLLWMLCEVMGQSPGLKLPTHLGNVFQVFTQTYEESSVRKHEVAALKGDVRPLSDRRLWKQALKGLAILMMQGQELTDFRVVVYRNEAERELSKIFPNEQFPVRDILDDLLKHHLLQNRGVNQIEFRHQLIQEYYAAEALLEYLPKLNDEVLKREYLNYLKWTEPLKLMLGMTDNAVLVMRVLALSLEVDLFLCSKLAVSTKLELPRNILGKAITTRSPRWLKLERSIQVGFGVPPMIEQPPGGYYGVPGSRILYSGEVDSDATVPELRQALQDENVGVCWSAVSKLKAVEGDKAAYILPDLLTLLSTKSSGIYALPTILGIQKNCKYYNIHQAHLEAQKHDRQTPQNNDRSQSITIQTQELTLMTDKAPIFNQQNATIGVNYAAEGSKQDFTQHINGTEQNFEILLANYKQFIDELQQENSNLTDETEITRTIDVEAKRIDARWQNFLNLKRLWNGGKKAAVKVGEHFVESNPWGKGAIAFLEGVSEDVK